MTPDRRSGDETHRRLLDAARTAFSRRGYHGTTTAEIAAAAGCSEPTLFKHFGSKQALLMAALRDAGATIVDLLAAPLPGGDDPFGVFAERARGLLFNPLLGEISRLRNHALVLVGEVEFGASTGVENFEAVVAEAVAAGQASGSVRPDVDPVDIGRLAHAISLLFAFDSAIAGDEVAAGRLSPLVDTMLLLLRNPERQVQ